MARPKKAAVPFSESLDIFCQTCTLAELESAENMVRIWKRVRLRIPNEPKAEHAKAEEKP